MRCNQQHQPGLGPQQVREPQGPQALPPVDVALLVPEHPVGQAEGGPVALEPAVKGDAELPEVRRGDRAPCSERRKVYPSPTSWRQWTQLRHSAHE